MDTKVHSAALEALSTAVFTEFENWMTGLPRASVTSNPAGRTIPDPFYNHPGGLPNGWTQVSLRQQYMAGHDLVLVRRDLRPDGGWIILVFITSHMIPTTTRLEVLRVARSLADLHTDARQEHRAQDGLVTEARIVRWLEETIVTMFDPDDAEENAERMLMAMGGRLERYPRAARRT